MRNLLIIVFWAAIFFLGIHPLHSQNQSGKKITVTGVAQNAKLGPIVQVGTQIYYLKDQAEWKPEVLNREVRVTGILGQFDPPVAEQKNGLWSAGVEKPGPVLRLEKIKWELVPNP